MVDEAATTVAREAFYAALLADDAEALYERAPCGYLSTTPDGLIVKANATFLTWTGWTAEDLVGRRRFVDLLTGGGRIYHETHYATALRMHSAVREIALDLLGPDGRRLPALVNAVLDRSDDGAPVVVRIAVFDASERRSYERELLAAKERAEDAEALANATVRTLQRTLLPPDLPEIPGVELGVAFKPAGEGTDLGGDFYDAFRIAPDDWLVLAGDVCGKGLEAAVVSTLTRHALRAVAVRSHDAADILLGVNDVLLQEEVDRYVTVVLVRLRQDDGAWTATVCAAGHPLPLLARGGELSEVGVHGSVVGLFDDPELTEVSLALEPGDLLVMYTDGVTEARHDGDMFGEDRLRASVRHHLTAGRSVAAGLLADALAHAQGPAPDDVAVLTLSIG